MDAYLWVTDNVLNQIKALDSRTFPGIQKVQETKRAHEIKKAQEIVDRIERRVLYKMIGEKKVIWEERSRSSVRYYCIILHICVRRGVSKSYFLFNSYNNSSMFIQWNFLYSSKCTFVWYNLFHVQNDPEYLQQLMKEKLEVDGIKQDSSFEIKV